MAIAERTRVENYIKYGAEGDFVENEANGRKIVRKSTHGDTLPTCWCFINGKFDNTRWGSKAIAWLYGEDK